MVELILGNSYSQVKGLDAKTEKALRSALSYVVGGNSARFSGFGVHRRSLLDKKAFFPTGLLERVAAFLENRPFIVTDNRIAPVRPTTVSLDGYPWQKAALRAALSRKRGIISAPTGSGKSRVITMISQSLGLKTLVVVPSLEIKKQLSESLKALSNVSVFNIDAKELQTTKAYDVLIIDEGHHVAAKTYQKLNKTAWTRIYHRYFLTATPFRNDDEETLLFESLAGSLIYRLNYEDAVKNKYIVPVESYVVDVPRQQTDACSWREVYRDLIIHNTPRNVLICVLLARLHSSRKSTLCLVKEVAHGKILSEMTGLPFISGDDDDSRKYIRQFSNGGISAVIATTGIMGEGVDSKAAEYIIVAGLGKAKSQFMQAVGRGVRTYPGKDSAKIVLFRDPSHKWTLSHYAAQKKVLKEEYESIPQKLEL